MAGTCRRCGWCCRTIALEHSKEVFKVTANPDHKFIYENFTEMSSEEAVKLNPHVAGIVEEYKQGERSLYWYTCSHLGDDNRCKDYENRPMFCRGYPWYGQAPPEKGFLYGPNCGFTVDLSTGVS
jgi:Fe-S-cluster containining protein